MPVPLNFAIERFVTGTYLGSHVVETFEGHIVIFRFVTDERFSITEGDFETLYERGFTRVQVNEPGTIDLYFEE